jgi:hypothetical protein
MKQMSDKGKDWLVLQDQQPPTPFESLCMSVDVREQEYYSQGLTNADKYKPNNNDLTNLVRQLEDEEVEQE